MDKNTFSRLRLFFSVLFYFLSYMSESEDHNGESFASSLLAVAVTIDSKHDNDPRNHKNWGTPWN